MLSDLNLSRTTHQLFEDSPFLSGLHGFVSRLCSAWRLAFHPRPPILPHSWGPAGRPGRSLPINPQYTLLFPSPPYIIHHSVQSKQTNQIMSSQHSSSHYQSPDNKKDEFRRYLEKSGAIESLTTVLVGLYEESDRPLESTEYIRRCLVGSDVSTTGRDGGGGASAGQQQENEKFKKENKEMKTKIHELNKTIETLRVNLKHAREEAKSAREEVRKLKSGKGGGS